MEYNQGMLFSGSFDHSIKRWDVRNTTMFSDKYSGHKGYIHALTIGDCSLMSG